MFAFRSRWASFVRVLTGVFFATWMWGVCAPEASAQTASTNASEEGTASELGQGTASELGQGTAVLDGDYMIDAKGRTYRVRFDPGSRLHLGAGTGMGGETGIERAPWSVLFGFDFRLQADYGQREHMIQWQLDHRFVSGCIAPWTESFAGVPATDAVFYFGTYDRHSRDSYITFPADPPWRVFFPSDLGAEAEVGRVRIPVVQPIEGFERMRITALRGTIWSDPLRTVSPGNGLSIGVGPRYDLDLVRDKASGEIDVVHRVAPFTAMMARVRLQDDAGLTIFDVRGDVVPHWSTRDDSGGDDSGESGWDWTYEAGVSLERVLISINDDPISLRLDGSVEGTPSPDGEETFYAWSALASLVWSVPLF